jgi:hypothetical protein
VSVFVVVFLKAERVVVRGFPDVLRNQRSEVLKNFKETFRKHELGKLWLNDHHCVVGRVGTGLRFAHRCRKHAIRTKSDRAKIIAESISFPMRCHSVVFGMARQTRSANAVGYRCIFLDTKSNPPVGKEKYRIPFPPNF